MTTSITTLVLSSESVKLFGRLTVCPFTMTGPFSSRKIPISLIDSVVVWGVLPNLSSVERSINRSSSATRSGLFCLPPLWISSSLCINSAKSSMRSSGNEMCHGGKLAKMLAPQIWCIRRSFTAVEIVCETLQVAASLR